MSDLQVSLLIIGAVVVGGVTAFNWFQQWRLGRRLEHGYAEKHHDVLHRDPLVENSSQRVEPQLESAHSAPSDEHRTRAPEVEPVAAASFSSAAAAFGQNLPAGPGFDPGIDY